jgi:hypothetical protein
VGIAAGKIVESKSSSVEMPEPFVLCRMSPEEKLAALLQPAEFVTRPLSLRERRYFGLRLRRIEHRWKSELRQTTIICALCFAGCLFGIWFSEEMPWWGAFFFLGLTLFAWTLMVLKEYWPIHFQRREIVMLLETGTCDELNVTTTEVWVIDNLGYGTCWYICAVDSTHVKLIDGGQYDFSPRLPAIEFSLRVYQLASGNIVEQRILTYGERMQPAHEFTCDFANTILDQPAYTFAGTLQSFCEAMRDTGIDLEETCPANAS